MPRKKKTSVSEEQKDEQQTKQEESFEEIIKSDTDSQTDDTGSDVEEEETPKDTDSEKVEEPKEEEKEEPKEEAVEIEPKEIAKEVKEKVKKEFVEKILTAVGEKPETVEKPKDDRPVPSWVKENRAPKSYEEVAEYGVELKDWKDKKAQEEQNKKAKEIEDINKQQMEAMNRMWDEQLEELRSNNKLARVNPTIKAKIDKGEPLTKEESNDEGLTEQRKLIQAMYDVSKKRQEQGKPAITNLKEIYYEHYNKPKQPAGADAPVSGGKSSVSQPTEEYDYKEIKSKDFYDILMEG